MHFVLRLIEQHWLISRRRRSEAPLSWVNYFHNKQELFREGVRDRWRVESFDREALLMNDLRHSNHHRRIKQRWWPLGFNTDNTEEFAAAAAALTPTRICTFRSRLSPLHQRWCSGRSGTTEYFLLSWIIFLRPSTTVIRVQSTQQTKQQLKYKAEQKPERNWIKRRRRRIRSVQWKLTPVHQKCRWMQYSVLFF